MFLVFGLNGFLNFLPRNRCHGPGGPVHRRAVHVALLLAVFALELVAGVLLLSNRFVRLALVILAAILVNIVFFHPSLAPAAFAPAVIAVALWRFCSIGNARPSARCSR